MDDNVFDRIDGGSGTDNADIDDLDKLIDVESVVL
jgi:hypothetical protein